MHELNGDRAFTDTGGHALHRAVARVYNRKDAGHVGFGQAGVAFERPTLGRLAVANQGRASQDEAVFVARHDAFQPVGAGLRASEYKQRAGVHAFARVGPPAFDGDGFQVVLTVHLRHLRLIFDLYIRGAGDLVDQVRQDEAVFVARHDAFQPVGAGLRASEYKQRAGVHAFARVGPPAFDGDGFQVVLTIEC